MHFKGNAPQSQEYFPHHDRFFPRVPSGAIGHMHQKRGGGRLACRHARGIARGEAGGEESEVLRETGTLREERREPRQQADARGILRQLARPRRGSETLRAFRREQGRRVEPRRVHPQRRSSKAMRASLFSAAGIWLAANETRQVAGKKIPNPAEPEPKGR